VGPFLSGKEALTGDDLEDDQPDFRLKNFVTLQYAW
jgi:hypothetical protein